MWVTLAVITIVGTSIGLFLHGATAAIVTPVSVTSEIDTYEDGNGGVANFGTPAFSQATTGASSCTSGLLTVPLSAVAGSSTATIGSTGGNTCTVGDYGEEFTIPLATATLSLNQSDNLTVVSLVGGQIVSTYLDILLTSPSTGGPFSAVLTLVIDYATVAFPAAGIPEVDLVVS
ncbi:MAG: hypothetical protein L3K03_01975 [Thermoplasmata archaeon]|nr:hypothetical protein [Thermoplasmata archaeon]